MRYFLFCFGITFGGLTLLAMWVIEIFQLLEIGRPYTAMFVFIVGLSTTVAVRAILAENAEELDD